MATLIDTWKANDLVRSLATSPDGTRVAAGCGSTVVMWDVHTGQAVFGPLQGHNDSVCSIAFSPDGLLLASGSYDCTIRIWDAKTGSPVFGSFGGHGSWVNSITFSNDGHYLISGSWDQTIRLWEVRTGRQIGNPIQAGSYVWSVVMSGDGGKIVCALSDTTIRVYDVATWAVLSIFEGHTNWVRSVALSPDGSRMASASDDGTVRIWDVVSGSAIGNPLLGHTIAVTSVAYSSDGKYIASGAYDQTIRIWDAETGALCGEPLRDHTGCIRSVEFAPGRGTCLISGSEDSNIKLWSVHGRNIRTEMTKKHISEQAQAIEAEITSTTTTREIISLLGARGCPNLTERLDIASCSKHPIAGGGFGDIYRGKLKDRTDVAIKTMRFHVGPSEQNQKNLKHAAREIYTWSKCRHPNVQPLLGLAMFRDQLGMVAKWASNGNLPHYLKEKADTDRCLMSKKIAEGLLYLHMAGVIHGDLKGDNVIISEDGIPQLADFGSAVLREYTLQFSQTSSTKGSLSTRWSAPELFKGSKHSMQADVYSLGMTILELMTGEVPWAEKRENSVLVAVVVENACPERPEAHIPTYSQHGDMLWLLLKWCWESTPEKRPNAVQVRTLLRGITQEGLKSVEVEMDEGTD